MMPKSARVTARAPSARRWVQHGVLVTKPAPARCSRVVHRFHGQRVEPPESAPVETLRIEELRGRISLSYLGASAPHVAEGRREQQQQLQLRQRREELQQEWTAKDWDRRDWAAPYVNYADESDGYWLDIEGVLPAEIHGTYMRNGPGTFTIAGQEVAHPFDGDGVVCSVSISGGRAFFRSQHVATRERAIEQQAGRRVFRSTFGTPAGPSWRANLLNPVPKNVANTNIIEWGPRCWALFESGQPYRLDPSTLATQGLDTAEGLFRANLPFTTTIPWLDTLAGHILHALHPAATDLHPGPLLGGDAVSSHPKVDPTRTRLVTMHYRLGVSVLQGSHLDTEVAFTEVDPTWGERTTTRHTLPGYSFLHDFFITPSYYGVFLNPLDLDLPPLVLGQQSPIHAVSSRPQGHPRIHLLPRPHRPDLRPLSFALPHPAFVFHHANGFEEVHLGAGEEGEGGAGRGVTVVVDSVHYDQFPDFHAFSGPGHRWQDVDADKQPPSRLVRVRLDTNSGAVEVREVSPRVLEFPCINPSRVGLPTRYVYSAAALHPTLNRPQQSIAKMDTLTGAVDMWSRGHRYYVGEPAFIPRCPLPSPASTPPTAPAHPPPPAPWHLPSGPQQALHEREDEGWVMAMCYDAAAARSEVVVLDARDVGAGPVAVMPLRTPIPHGLHGSWLPCYHGPPIPGPE